MRFHNSLDGCLVARLGGADEIVIGAAEGLDHAAEDGRVLVGQFDRRDAFLFRRLLHLLAVFVRSGQEKNILAIVAGEASQHIGRDRGVGVADMRGAVGIENRRRDVEAFVGRHSVGSHGYRFASG